MKIEGLNQLMNDLQKAASGDLKKEFAVWLEAMGMEFLDLVQDEIIRTETVDTRRLLNSFDRGDGDNVWQLDEGGLKLEIGTSLSYAQLANDGHFTIDPDSGKDRRWVPGKWVGDRFEYDPGATTGMLLKFQWVEGSNYWNNALAIFERLFQSGLERRMQRWLEQRFEG